MSNPWFRMYSEFVSDPKVQMLSEAMQRRYVMLMCLRCSNALVTLHETEIAFALRISDEELALTKALFISKKFIDSEWNLVNWEKRQFASDSSAVRVAEHRKRKKEAEINVGNGTVTLLKQKANALEQNRTDTEQKKEKPSASLFQKFWDAYPKKEARKDAEVAFAKLNPTVELLGSMLSAVESRVASSDWTKDRMKYVPLPATWLRAERWTDEAPADTRTIDIWAGAVN